MIVLRKKRILYIASVLMVSFMFYFAMGIERHVHVQDMEATAVVATPATNKVVIIDAGHGYPEQGGRLLHL